MKNAKFHTLDVKRCCENKLDITFRNGKEFNGWVLLQNIKYARITVPKGRKPLQQKTYKSMANQLKLSTDQFDDLLECNLDRKGYENTATRPRKR